MGTETVLLVDDEKTVRQLTREMLQCLGYTVLTAATGQEAVRLFEAQRERISLVLLDMVMPQMGGSEVLQRIRSIHAGVRVLLCSGHAFAGQPVETMEQNGYGFIRKPFSLQEISKQIRTLLDC